MADGSTVDIASLKSQVSGEEWAVRTNLAALYRLVALNGWDDMIFTHISARVPGTDKHFLINPYGLLFEEVTASSLIKIDLDGKILQNTPYLVNAAGFTIHSAVHGARDDAHFVMHLHTDHGIGVAAQAEGLLPLSQHALSVLPRLAYHNYEGIALNLDERQRLVADLGDKTLMLLRNHGTMAVGATAGECWFSMVNLERACKIQAIALAGGREHVLLTPEVALTEVRNQMTSAVPGLGAAVWPGALRQLDRRSPGYDT